MLKTLQYGLIWCMIVGGYFLPASAEASGYLSASEIGAVSLGTAGISIIGMKVRKIPLDKKPVIRGHLPFEQSFQRWLGGKGTVQKSNFLDTKFGGFATPLASGIALTLVNVSYPRGSRGKDVSQDMFLFASGALATKGITDIAKGIFARERPFMHLLSDSLTAESRYGHSFLQHSFFSGHTSGAFFSASFLNLRLRETMRRRMTQSEYRSWRWVSSGLLYSWASFVGLSRVQAYKHHPSDVLVGALAGVLISELFFNFGNKANAPNNSSGNNNAPLLLQISVPF